MCITGYIVEADVILRLGLYGSGGLATRYGLEGSGIETLW